MLSANVIQFPYPVNTRVLVIHATSFLATNKAGSYQRMLPKASVIVSELSKVKGLSALRNNFAFLKTMGIDQKMRRQFEA